MIRTLFLAAVVPGLLLARATMAGEHASVAPPPPPTVHRAVDGGIRYLQTQSGTWLKQGRCAACHHAAMPLWALNEAARHGYAVDQRFLADTAESTLGSRKKMIARGILANPDAPPDPRPMARGVNTGAVFMAVAVESMSALSAGQEQSLASIAADIVTKQQKDGSWEFFLSRPPINENQATDTAWILMALQGEMRSKPTEAMRTSLENGTHWLQGVNPGNALQVRVLKLLVATRAGESRSTTRPLVDDLLARQNSDGGWSQLEHGKSDAFATGQTLYVLATAGCTSEDPTIQRAVDFLVRTQKPDGSWPMTSRATPDGRPGSAKLLTPITCGATAWATMGLANLAPEGPK